MRAVIENKDDMLRAGMSFQVAMKFPGDTYPSVNPLSVQWGTDGAFVWAIKDGKAKRTPVRIIQRNTESVLVEADLTDEDLVVTEGIHTVREGADVQIASREPAARRARRDRRLLIHGGCRQMTTQTPIGEGETGITALFVRRPVLAFVINTLIAVAGLAAFYGVEIRELPDVDRPVITVNTDFTGASAETIDRELTAVLEGAVSRVSGVKAISSASSFGRSRVTVEFNDGVNLDVAASDMRDAVARVTNQLPEDADPPRIVKADANSDAVMRLAVTSDTKSVEDMTIIVEDEILDTLSAVPGVADVQVYGDRDKIFRVDINQAKVASLGLTIADIANALATVAFDTPAGSLTTGNQDIVVRATATVNTPEAFENIIIKGRAKLGDVAIGDAGRRPERHLAALRRQDRHRARHHPRRAVEHAGHFDGRPRRGGEDPGDAAGRHEHPRHQRRRHLHQRRHPRGRAGARPFRHHRAGHHLPVPARLARHADPRPCACRSR